MTEEISDGDDYADWIKWASNAKESRISVCESARNVFEPVLLQQHKHDHDSVIPMILQIAQVETGKPNCKPNEEFASCSHFESGIRWLTSLPSVKHNIHP